ncbi:MAG: AAA family ATPase [Nakamurella sp.]
MGGPERHPVGRALEIQRLSTAFRAIDVHRPATVLVRGEAGIGKSALVNHFALIAAADRFMVVRGFCAPISATVLPYAPIVGLVTELLRDVPDLVGSLSPEVQRGLWPLTGAVDITVTDRNATRLFAGFVELLVAASRHRKLLVIVEDLHWADPASIDLLSYTARTIRAPVGLLLTERDAAKDGSVGAELSRAPWSTVVRLRPLDDGALQQLLARLDHPPDTERSASITAMAGGIPFLAIHLAAHRDFDATPASLPDALAATIDELPDAERWVLVLLAVIGRQADDILLRAAALPSRELDAICRTLRKRNLISVSEEGIVFRHALIGESVLRSMLPGERRDAHAAAADALLAAGSGRDPAQAGSLSYHLHGCGRHREALPHTVLAARRANAVWAFSAARTIYDRLRRWWPMVENATAAAGIGWDEVLRESASAAQWSGDPRAALDLLGQAAALENQTPITAAETQLAIGRALAAAGETNDALAAYRRSLAVLPPECVDPLRVTASAALAQALMLAGHSQEAISVAAEAESAAVSGGADRDRMHAVITGAAARAQLGEAEMAVGLLRDCQPEVRRLDDLELTLRCHSNLTFALGLLGRHDEAARAAADGIQACKRYGDVTSLVTNLRNNQVSALVTVGRWDEAVAAANDGLENVSNPGVALYLRTRIAEVELARGHRSAADAELTTAQALGVEDPYAAAALGRLFAERALQDGDPRGALAAISPAVDALRRRDDAVPLLLACWLALRAAADLAESDGARFIDPMLGTTRDEHLTLARAAADRSSLDAAGVLLATCEAEAARATAADTDEQWQQAAAGWQRQGEPYYRAYCLFRLAAQRLRAQARTAAAQALDESRWIAERLGAAPLSRRIQQLATVGDLPVAQPASAGQAKPSSRPDPFGLTARERQVLELLTTGASNRKVARSLNISERTAGVHVSNILNKLGAKNRTEAARIALTRLDSSRMDRFRP